MFWCGHHIECAICGVANIPDGIDWPWVKDGRLVHAQCLHNAADDHPWVRDHGDEPPADIASTSGQTKRPSEIHADEMGDDDMSLGEPWAAGRAVIAVIENAVGRRVTEHLGPDTIQLRVVETVNGVNHLHMAEGTELYEVAVLLAESVGIDLKE